MGWTFEVSRTGLASTRVVEDRDETALEDGTAVLAVERFALTANNVTYAKLGESLGYWRFFTAPAGCGIVPVWGFATVVRSAAAGLAEGARVYGYLPTASHLVVRPDVRGRGREFVDAASHRAELPAVYNSYSLCGAYAPVDDYRALLQPLLVTSYLIDEYLAEASFFGAARVVLSSASSKTALGLAWLLKRRHAVEVAGVTSQRNFASIASTQCYDTLVSYDAVDDLVRDAKTVFVDFAGDRELTARAHALLGDTLVKSVGVGAARATGDAAEIDVPSVRPEFFFAPDHARKRMETWGADGFLKRFRDALGAFVAANPWLEIDFFEGPQGLKDAWRRVVASDLSPKSGIVVRL